MVLEQEGQHDGAAARWLSLWTLWILGLGFKSQPDHSLKSVTSKERCGLPLPQCQHL